MPAYEPEVSSTLADILREEGVNIVTDVAVQRVFKEGDLVTVIAESRGTEARYQAKQLLIATGRRPNTDDIGLKHVGVQTDERGFVLVDEYLRTNLANVWAAGDVIGKHRGSQLATPVGAHDGVIVAVNALSGEKRKATTP